MKARTLLLVSICLLLLPPNLLSKSKDYILKSPSGKLEMFISVGDQLQWGLSVEGKRVLDGCSLGLRTASPGTVTEFAFCNAEKLKKVRRDAVKEHIKAPFYRQAEFDAEYNSLKLSFKSGWGIEARAYDDGVAYRIVSDASFDVLDEEVNLKFTEKFSSLVPYTHPLKVPFQTSFENIYTRQDIGTPDPENCLAFTPVYVDAVVGKLLIMESDVENYPGIFLKGTENGFSSVFPPVPNDKEKRIAKNVDGSRMPWRIIAYAKEDKDLAVNNMVYALGAPGRVEDTSWIEPGKSSWDWWNAFTLYGVDFKAGINTESYKYHIDFAAKFGIPYVLIDDGWYYRGPDPGKHDMTRSIPEMDIPEICRYAKEKGVKIVLWCSKGALIGRLEKIFDMYSAMGVSGFKVDFFDAQNQNIVKMAYRILESAARHHLVIDLHGFYKPTGINRTWPNLLNVEGVFGLENIKWMKPTTDMPRNDVIIPFVRQAAGIHDYTPGAMRNGGKSGFHTSHDRAISQGSRAHQVALYLVFDMPFAMLCDSPSDYLKEEETTRFIASLPTVFDRTIPLSGKVEESAVLARCKDDVWYVGGITSSEGRTVDVDFSFLPAGSWNVEFFHDGINADRVGEDYVLENLTVDNTVTLPVRMSCGGGFAMIIKKK